MELLCIEREFEPTASMDGVILDDDRLLHNLILAEERYLITGSYFKCLQTDLKPSMREVVANWMLEVCEEERCQREVYPLAMNLLDRFLAVVRINKTQLQLLGSVCLFIASKMRQSRPLSPKALVQYTDWSITLDELTGWEMLVLSRLKWDVAAVPPNDFVGPLLRRLAKKFKLIGEHYVRIKKHTLNMIDLCSADFNFSMLPSSMVAAASIITTIDGILYGIANRDANTLLLFKSLSSQILYHLHEITGIEKELLCECQRQIEQKIGGPPSLPPHAPVHPHHHGHHPYHHHHHHQPQPVSCGVASATAEHSVSLKSSSLVGVSNGGCGPSSAAVLVDCPKENYNSSNSLINSADNCGLHPRLFKHTPCVVSDASIGVEF